MHGGGGEIKGAQQRRQVGAGLGRTVTVDGAGVYVCTLCPGLSAACARQLPTDCRLLSHRVSADRRL